MIETEFKVPIEGTESSARLAEVLARRGTPLGPPRLQVNHFFDTAAGDLRAAGLALRLREEEGRFRLTAKARAADASGPLTSRPEVEVPLSPASARELLEGRASPLDLLRPRAAADPQAAPLLTALDDCLRERPLLWIGAFENERRRTPPIHLRRDPPLAVHLELDHTRFPGDHLERELEVEVPTPTDLPLVETWLRTLLDEVGLPWKTAPSKAARFFALLAEPTPSHPPSSPEPPGASGAAGTP